MTGMGRFKKSEHPRQGYLLPPSIEDWLPEGHLAWFIHDAVEQLEIGDLLDAYRQSGKGKLPYHPRMMLRVLIYGYCTGVFSSRKIAKHLEENIAFRVLGENQMPGHRTICRFRELHLAQFESLFVQVVQLASSSGLTKLGTLAIDGTKVKANASKRKAMSYERMQAEEQRLGQEIRELTARAAGQDAKEDELFGPDFRGDELPAELARRETRLTKLRAAKKRLEARKVEEAKAEDERKAQAARDADRQPPKDRPEQRKHAKGKPKPKDQENFTDPDSRIMKASTGFEQCFNAQIGVDGKHRLIVANSVTNNAADNGQLLPMVEAAMRNTGQPAGRVLADMGYKSERNLHVLEQTKIDGYVAVGREGKQPRPCAQHYESTASMRRKLATKRGRRNYGLRKHIAEPPIGWIKHVLGFRGFSLRGLSKVAGEWNLVCLATNLRRMIQWRAQLAL